MRKIIKKVMFVLLAVSMIGFGPIDQLTSYAAEVQQAPPAHETQVHIFKIGATETINPFAGTGIKDGEILTNIQKQFKDANYVNGAGYTVYEVTKQQQEDLTKYTGDNNLSDREAILKDAIKAYKQLPLTGDTNYKYGEPQTALVEGETVATLPNGYYWVEETTVPPTYENSDASSFALTLPAYINGEISNTLYVYPKNVLKIPFNPLNGGKNNPPTLTKNVVGGTTAGETTSKSVSVGEEETWNITATVPNSVKSLKELVFLDVISQYLEVVPNSLTVTTGANGTETTLYTGGKDQGGYFSKAGITVATDDTNKNVSTGQSLLDVEFSSAGIAKLVPGQKIVITFSTKVKSNAPMGRNIYNGVKVIYSNNPGHNYSSEIPGNPNKPPTIPTSPTTPNEPIVPNPPTNPDKPEAPHTGTTPDNPYTPFVNTGGKKFKKIAKDSESTALSGAQFAVIRTNSSGNIEFLALAAGQSASSQPASAKIEPTEAKEESAEEGKAKPAEEAQSLPASEEGSQDKSSSSAQALPASEEGSQNKSGGSAQAESKLGDAKTEPKEASPQTSATQNTIPATQWIDTGVKATDATTPSAVKKAIEAVSSKGTPEIFTSGKDGTFEVMGIPFGTYNLVEMQAPKDYAIPENLSSFKIDATSYYKNAYLDGSALTAENNIQEPSSNTGGIIENTKYTIPQTGGIGTIILTAIGIALIVGAYIIYKKNNLNRE